MAGSRLAEPPDATDCRGTLFLDESLTDLAADLVHDRQGTYRVGYRPDWSKSLTADDPASGSGRLISEGGVADRVFVVGDTP